MLVIVKSGPDTPEGMRAFDLARELAADLVLMQDGVYFARLKGLAGFCGMVYLLDDDLRLRGLKDDDLERGVMRVDLKGFADLLALDERVLGFF